MELRVNDYVRTNYGIAKITKIYLKVNACEIDKQLNDFYFVLNENIIKSSSNIIDLIEVGDYVNGYMVTDFVYGKKGHEGIMLHSFVGLTFYENDIKSIVTKEQFESMEYKIGE